MNKIIVNVVVMVLGIVLNYCNKKHQQNLKDLGYIKPTEAVTKPESKVIYRKKKSIKSILKKILVGALIALIILIILIVLVLKHLI